MRCAASAAHRFRANVRKCRFSSASRIPPVSDFFELDTSGYKFRLRRFWPRRVSLVFSVVYVVRPSGFEPPTFCSGGKESMPKGKQSYVPGLGKKSVARHSGEVRKPVSIALSTQFSTQLV